MRQERPKESETEENLGILIRLDLSKNHIPKDFQVEDKKGLSLEEEIVLGETKYRISLMRNDYNSPLGPPGQPNPKTNYLVFLTYEEEPRVFGDEGKRFESKSCETLNEALNLYFALKKHLTH